MTTCCNDCATSRKVAVSIPDVVTVIFYWHDPSGRTMALGLTQPLTEMSTRNISWGKRRPVRRVDNLITFMYQLSWNLGASTSWNPQGLSRPVMGLLYLYFTVWYSESYGRNQVCWFWSSVSSQRDLGLKLILHTYKLIFQYTSNKMQLYTVYLYLETALHVLGGTSTHHQECIQLYLQHLAFVTTPLLLPSTSGR